jgi:AhpD family alkylhydroperoxidase
VEREMVEREMKEVLGRTPAALDRVPDELVDADWRLLRRTFVDDSLIPTRYQALIGVAVAAAVRCPYAARLHTELARVHGASEAELAEAVHHAAMVSSWSTRLHGFAFDAAEFDAEVADIAAHIAGRLAVD